MPLPRRVARLNARYTNRFIEPFVARLPGFVVIVHTGRVTGTTYHTPAYTFASDTHLLIAMTYGPDTDWVKNVLTNGASIDRRGHIRPIVSSAIVGRSAAWPFLPLIVRVGLRALRVTDFLQVQLD